MLWSRGFHSASKTPQILQFLQYRHRVSVEIWEIINLRVESTPTSKLKISCFDLPPKISFYDYKQRVFWIYYLKKINKLRRQNWKKAFYCKIKFGFNYLFTKIIINVFLHLKLEKSPYVKIEVEKHVWSSRVHHCIVDEMQKHLGNVTVSKPKRPGVIKWKKKMTLL